MTPRRRVAAGLLGGRLSVASFAPIGGPGSRDASRKDSDMLCSRKVATLASLAAAALLATLADPALAIDPNQPWRNTSNQPGPNQQGLRPTGQPTGAQPGGAFYQPTQQNTFQYPTTNSQPVWGNQPGSSPFRDGQMVPPIASQQPTRYDGGFARPVSRNYAPADPNGRDFADPYAPGGQDYHPVLNPQDGQPVNDRAAKGPNRWRLGVFTRDTYTGVEIARIAPDSPAAQVGLEQGDTIVAVNGFRVGDVHGVRYDLGAEFNMRADENGLVHMLVHNHRDGRLANVSANLDPRLSRVTGQITWSSRQQLPARAYAVVELQEIFRVGTQPIVVAQREIRTLGSNDAPFEIEFDPGDIDQSKQYVIAASITDGRLTYFRDVRPVSVITRNAPRQVAVAMQQIYDWTGQQQYAEANEFEEFQRLWRKYMGRPMRDSELALYRSQFNRGMTTQEAEIDAFSHPDFYNGQCDADDRNFVTNVYRLRTGQEPTEREIRYWLDKLAQAPGVRRATTREMLSTLN